MTDQLTELQELVLDLVVESHTAVEDIVTEVRLLMGNGVSVQQMTDALVQLREARLVNAYVCEDERGSFERYRRVKLKRGVALWWFATAAGRAANASTS